MFQHVTTLFSFIFAIALTHVFASISELVSARDRVRFSGLHALWMSNVLVALLINWMSVAQLSAVKHWSAGEILLQLSWVIPQYFACSLISMSARDSELLDMRSFYERQRAAFFSAMVLLDVASMVVTFADRNNLEGFKPGDWIIAELFVAPMLVAALLAGWARRVSLQWIAGGLTLALEIWFFTTSYVMPT
jgi:hypothetical protein